MYVSTSALSGGHLLGGRRELNDSEVVAERVAQAAVDSVGVFGRLFAELDASSLQGLVGLPAIGCCETKREAAAAFADRFADLGGGLLVHAGRGRDLEQDVAAGITGYPNRQPAHEAEVHVGADLEAELADVEVEGLLLVEDEYVRNVDCVEHGILLSGLGCFDIDA